MAEEHHSPTAELPEAKQTAQHSLIDGLERPATVFLSYAHEDTEFVKGRLTPSFSKNAVLRLVMDGQPWRWI